MSIVRVDELAKRYRSTTSEFIERLLTACQLSDFDEALAIRRYLERDTSIAITPEFLACHRELMDERHRPRRQST